MACFQVNVYNEEKKEMYQSGNDWIEKELLCVLKMGKGGKEDLLNI